MIKNKMMMFLSIMLLSLATVSYAQTISLKDTTVAAGTTVNLPIKVTNLSKVGAISLGFTYNTAALTYKGFVASPDLNVDPQLVKEPTTGDIRFAWYASTPVNITSGVIGYLQFTLKSGSGAVSFNQSLCELSAIPYANITTTYTNGSISEPAAQPAALTLGSLSAKKGDTVSVALSATSLKNIGSLSLTINYSTSALKFVGFANNVNNFTVPSANTDGNLNIGYVSTVGKAFDGKLIDVKFVLLGGNSTVSISGEVTDVAVKPVTVIFNPGTITEIVPVVGVSLGAVRATANKTVSVPMMVTQVNNIGSMSLKLKYDPAVLTYKEIKNFAGTGLPNAMESNGVLTIGYASTTPITISTGKVMDIVFTYKSGTTNVTFDPSSEITDGKAVVITNIAYTAGSIAVNAGPVIAKVADQTVKENDKLTFDLSATDAENDPITFSASAASMPKGATLTGKTFTWTPSYTDAGSYKVTFFAADSIGAVDSTVANITVTNVNRKPVFTTALKDTAIAENQAIAFTYAASDPDNDAVTFVAKSLPTGATFDTKTGAFAWKPNYGQKGVYSVVIGISDGSLTDSTTAKISVSFTNRPPVFTAVPNDTTLYLKAATGLPYYATYKFVFKATDPDGDAITYALVSAPSKFTFDAPTATLTYTLALNDTVIGGKVIVKATDVNNGVAVDTMTFTVKRMTSVSRELGVPAEYSLKQNFPNPFNPTTSIKYALPNEAKVSLRVFNLIGQEVAVLVNQTQQAGNYVANFNAANLPSGMYIYRLEAGNFVQTRKMTLLK